MNYMPNLKPLSKGLLSFAVPSLRTVHGYGNPLGTISAASCYSIFLRHLTLLHGAGVRSLPKNIAELGPGTSLGTGFAALLSGAEKYYALDVVNFADKAQNLAIFDEILALFRSKAAIPASGIHSLRFPDLQDYEFPAFLDFEPDAAFERRASAIRRDIEYDAGEFVQSAAPWTEASILEDASLDWIFSQSVLEHVDDLEPLYHLVAGWLKPGGYASHLIDFGSHGMTREWNAHWALSDLAWNGLRGRRPYLINRVPYAHHARLSAESGLVTVFEKGNKRFDGLVPEQFVEQFQTISDEDARTRMMLTISRRPAAISTDASVAG